MIRPGFLPVGISTSNIIIKPGYESYQPVIAARQFGLGQVPPNFQDLTKNFLMRVANQLDVLAMAKLYLVSLAVN